MKKYQRLNDLEREEISRMLSQKCSFHDIAKALGRNVSTISREIGAGSCNQYTYRAAKAQKRASRNASKRKTGKKKYLSINTDWINHCKKQKKKLSTLYGKELYKKRSHDVEGVFGNIKKNLKFTHFNLRGFRGVKVEWNLISIAHNMQKLTKPITT